MPQMRRFFRDRAHFDPAFLLAEVGETDPTRGTDRLIDFLLGHHVPASRREPLLRFVKARGDRKLRGESLVQLLVLITAMPEYQLC